MSEPVRTGQRSGRRPAAEPVLAVDAGGTSTRTVVVDGSGRCLGYGRAGSGNPTSSGPAAAAGAVAASAAMALEGAGVPASELSLVVLAMAGHRSAGPLDELHRGLEREGVTAPVVFESDQLAMYFSGTHLPQGYGVVAGTGAAAIRVEDGQAIATSDGLGWLLGDEGSGFWIGQRVVRAALADLDGRGPATALTPLLLHRLDLGAAATSSYDERREVIARALERLYALRPVRLAQFADLAFDAYGDAVADGIVTDAVAGLARTLAAVASPVVSGPVVLGGGILTHHPALALRVVSAFAGGGALPDMHTVADGVVGAATLALRHAGVGVGAAEFERLVGSLAPLR
ncbi:N-acetylglucosamine kinase [Nocardioides cheoyonin]|uniref:N-acetylglucosamine kinase n=1 Tax=Nocardioides cheoyonin TaxID=3156615 RepID=UPI0032B52C7A